MTGLNLTDSCQMKGKRMVIGVTGGVGTGKSTVLSILQKEYGAKLIIADDIAKELMEPGKQAYEAVLSFFGEEVLCPEKDTQTGLRPIDRGSLSRIVFADPDMLSALNHMTHPLVRKEIEFLLKQYEEEGVKMVVIETALLLQAGYRDLVDELWVIHTDYETRVLRLKESRGYSREKTDAIIRNQLPDEVMEAQADVVIDNSKEPDDISRQIARHLSHIAAPLTG